MRLSFPVMRTFVLRAAESVSRAAIDRRSFRVLPVFTISAVCLMGLCKMSTAADEIYKLVASTMRMSPGEAAGLEEKLVKTPQDIEARSKLLIHYTGRGRSDLPAMMARQGHVLWLIANAPESEVLGLPYGHLDGKLEATSYKSGQELWLKHVKESPENLSILRNAASYFQLTDRNLAEQLFLKGQKFDPKDSRWASSLGHLYSRDLQKLPAGEDATETGKKAWRQFELAYKHASEIEKDSLLASLAKTAVAAGEVDKAKEYATKMLQNNASGWNRGNRIHHGNLILGRIALLNGDVAEAKAKLILAGKTPGSPQLNSFGPNMQLAQELLAKGESEVVLEYFDLCGKFWKLSKGKLETWTADVKAGRAPDFGANLAY